MYAVRSPAAASVLIASLHRRSGRTCPTLPLPSYGGVVQFSPDLRAGVARGEITVSVRLWARRQVREGGCYRTAGTVIEVDSIEVLPFAALTEQDIAATGEGDREAVRRRAAHAGPVHDDTLVHRIEFHVVD